mmetsp:Transcript_15384/g.42890  ORF Transcript_15384/g.42890 Transcript_15384/m.42890 type:complete len:259 (-) Transcript_15384:157-933(-)
MALQALRCMSWCCHTSCQTSGSSALEKPAERDIFTNQRGTAAEALGGPSSTIEARISSLVACANSRAPSSPSRRKAANFSKRSYSANGRTKPSTCCRSAAATALAGARGKGSGTAGTCCGSGASAEAAALRFLEEGSVSVANSACNLASTSPLAGTLSVTSRISCSYASKLLLLPFSSRMRCCKRRARMARCREQKYFVCTRRAPKGVTVLPNVRGRGQPSNSSASALATASTKALERPSQPLAPGMSLNVRPVALTT